MSQRFIIAALAAVVPSAIAQQLGTQVPNTNPSLPTWKCTTSGGCIQKNTSIALDYNFHWLHEVNSTAACTSCTTSGTQATCSDECVIEGVNYTSNGVSVTNDALTLRQYMQIDGETKSVSPRVYLLGEDGDYEMMQLLGQELSFDVDVSTLVCGENGALYFSEMDKAGGANPLNPGGASYGSGYCDAQSPVQTWYNGTINTANKGYGCNEMDIWEANANATAYTPHPCQNGTCDKSGCGFNPYAQGDKNYYANGGTVDTLKPMTVVTQFYTADNSTTSSLAEIRRLYIQNGVVIQNSVSTVNPGMDSIKSDWCDTASPSGAPLGGLKTMGESLARGMVLIFSIWNDASEGHMSWLDSGDAGPCTVAESDPAVIAEQTPGTYVTFSNIRWGDIGSTFSAGNETVGYMRSRRGHRARLA
jgi:cellulase